MCKYTKRLHEHQVEFPTWLENFIDIPRPGSGAPPSPPPPCNQTRDPHGIQSSPLPVPWMRSSESYGSHKNESPNSGPPHSLQRSRTPYLADEKTGLQGVTPPLESQDLEVHPRLWPCGKSAASGRLRRRTRTYRANPERKLRHPDLSGSRTFRTEALGFPSLTWCDT